ncbi:MAG: hypothetical protein PQJ46_15365, partial [Spirochaetales bacterium]|nr:hypothetical protein [Spirochaetales bacterium]
MRKKSVFLIIILMFLPFTIFAEYIDDENIASDVTSAEADSGEVLDFTLGVEISLGVNILGFIPGAFSILGIPLSLSSESVSFVPQGGFFYCSNLWSDLHNSFYIPAGLTVLYNPFKLGCNFMYYFPVGGDNDNQM